MQEYPKLLWRPDGREVTAGSKTEEDALRAEGCKGVPSGHEEPKPVTAHATAHAKTEPVEPDEVDEADVTAHGGRKKK